jgi:hypothetical protein
MNFCWIMEYKGRIPYTFFPNIYGNISIASP